MTTKAIEAGARAMEHHDMRDYEWTDEQFETWWTKDPRAERDRENQRARAKACIEAAIASGELVPASAAAAERKTTPDWGRLVQCVLRCMDATIKNESSREQAERIATAIEERFAMDSAAERERCIKIVADPNINDSVAGIVNAIRALPQDGE